MNRTIEVDVKPTPEELAEAWWEMDGDKQALFFNRLHDISLDEKCKLPFQLQWVTDSKMLTKEGRKVMEYIGMYANPSEQ